MRLKAFIQTLQGRKVFFEPLSGNHGDTLLTLAARQLMADAGVYPVNDCSSADMILLNGGGSMVDGWNGLQTLKSLCEKYPDTPLSVLPSSFYFKPGTLEDILGNRQAPVWLWAREETSLAILLAAVLPASVHLEIDHDLAFFLSESEIITSLQKVEAGKQLLIVERDDWEGPTGRRRVLAPPGLDFIPESLRTAVRRHVLGPFRRKQDKSSVFRRAALAYIHQNQPGTDQFSCRSADISLPEVCDFDTFLQHIATASFVVTTRLHVAVVAHMLNKKACLVDGRYHKFQGVFDYSMRHGPCSLARWDADALKLQDIQSR